MAITTTYHYTMDLDKGGLREVLRDPLYTLNSKAHTFAIEVKQGASAASLNGAKCTGYFIRTDGVTVPIDGAVSGNVASVTLLPNCYAVQGRFDLSVDLILGDVIHTILHVDGSILRSRTDSMTTGGSKVQSFDELVSAVQGVDAAMKRRDRVVNLLDNSDFRNPVNQRDVTETGDAGYNIDRWLKGNASGIFAVGDDYVSLTGNGAWWFFRQRVNPKKIISGRSYTVAFCDINGDKVVYTTTLTNNMAAASSPTMTFATAGIAAKINIGWENDAYGINLTSASTTELKLAWAALYEGTYTADTLPEYQPKGYTVELMECMRYFQQLDYNLLGNGYTAGSVGWAVLQVDTKVKMRVLPTVYIDGDVYARVNGTDYELTWGSISAGLPENTSYVELLFTNDALPVRHPAAFHANGAVWLSADL